MADLNPEELWFNTPDTATLCRAGGNGPNHPSQLYAIEKYVVPIMGKPGMKFLDYGCGSGTTFEAIYHSGFGKDFWMVYKGVDIIPKNIEWCKEHFGDPGGWFEINQSIHKIDQPDKSWDVVYSRHVVDHMDSFEHGLDEHCRVAKELVIIVLWRPLGDKPEHDIKHIVDQEKVYENEYTNDYSKPKVLEAIKSKEKEGWKLLELAEGVGKEVKGWDTVIVLKRNGTN